MGYLKLKSIFYLITPLIKQHNCNNNYCFVYTLENLFTLTSSSRFYVYYLHKKAGHCCTKILVLVLTFIYHYCMHDFYCETNFFMALGVGSFYAISI